MSIFGWLKNIFAGSAKETRYNLLLVSCQSQPVIGPCNSKKKVSLILDGKGPIQLPKELLSAKADFRKLPEGLGIPKGYKGGIGQIWYLPTHCSSDEFKVGKGYVYLSNKPSGKNNKKNKGGNGRITKDAALIWVKDPAYIQSFKEFQDSSATNPSTPEPKVLTPGLSEESNNTPDIESAAGNTVSIHSKEEPKETVNVPSVDSRENELKETLNVPSTDSQRNEPKEPVDEPTVSSGRDVSGESADTETVECSKEEIPEREVAGDPGVDEFGLQITNMLEEMGCTDFSDNDSTDVLLDKLRGQIKSLQKRFTENRVALQKKDEELKEKLQGEKVEAAAPDTSAGRQNEALRIQNEELKKEIQKKDSLIDEGKARIAVLDINLKSKDRQLQDQSRGLEEKEAEMGNIKSRLQKQEVYIRELEDQLKDLKQESLTEKRVESPLESVPAETDSDRKDLRSKEEENRELQAALTNLKEKEASSIKTLREKEEQISRLEDEVNIRRNKEDGLNLRIQQLEESQKQKRLEMEGLKTRYAQVENDYQKVVADLKDVRKAGKIREKELEKLNSERETLINDLNAVNEEFRTVKSQYEDFRKLLQKTKEEKDSLVGDIKLLEEENLRLSDEKSAETERVKCLSALLESDIDAQAAVYQSAAGDLEKAVEKVFLKECNEDEEMATVEGMCAKIRKGVRFIASEIAELRKDHFNSTAELDKAYRKIISDNIEDPALMEIARWWAYSRLAFVLDRSREEGRTVELDAIEKAYGALSRLLSLAGYRYQIPVLFTQKFKEGEFENLTGREQLNLDYQVPNVRNHVKNIDRGDAENIVLDIVRLGYYEGDKLLKKTSVIVQ